MVLQLANHQYHRSNTIYPLNEAANISINPELNWSNVLEAKYYKLQISDNINFNEPIIIDSTFSTEYLTAYNLEYITQYGGEYVQLLHQEQKALGLKYGLYYRSSNYSNRFP